MAGIAGDPDPAAGLPGFPVLVDGPPIDLLPNELLAAIFEARHTFRLDKNLSVSYPVAVSQVSRRWRAVALHTPAIWTYVTVEPTSSKMVNAVQTFLARSGGFALDICVTEQWLAGVRPAAPYLNQMWSLLVPEAHRWRSLVMDFTVWDSLRLTCRTLEPLCVPQLTYLRMSAPGQQDPFNRHLVPLFANGAPSLSSLRVASLPLLPSSPRSDTITDLQIFRSPYDILPIGEIQIRDLFRATPRLASLRMVGAVMYLQNGVVLPPIIIPSLTSLSVAFDQCRESQGPFYGTRVRASFDLPGLRSLHIAYVEEPGEFGHLLISLSLRGSIIKYPRLATLHLSRVGDHVDPSISTVFPSISEFRLSFVDPRFLLSTVLQPQMGAAVQLPHLETLLVWGYISYEDTLKLVRSRVQQGAPLKRIGAGYDRRGPWKRAERSLLSQYVEIVPLPASLCDSNYPLDSRRLWEPEEIGYTGDTYDRGGDEEDDDESDNSGANDDDI